MSVVANPSDTRHSAAMRIAPFELERYLNALEFSARHYICGSDVEGYRLSELLELATADDRERFASLSLGYTTAPGLEQLREEIARLYTSVAADQVLTFAGAEEAIFILMNVLCGPGDHVVTVWPAYQSLHEVARATGADVTLVELRESEKWALDLEGLKRAMRPTTKLVVINFPHNPTGAHLDKETYRQVVDIARDAGAYLLCDEVYRHSEYDASDRLAAGVDVYARAISLGVMSKTFALAGLRIGWIATHDRSVLEACAAYKDYISICNSAPSEWLALIALRAREKVIARSLAIIHANMALLDSFFQRRASAFSWVKPRAGTIAFPSFRTRTDVDAIARELVQHEGVVILPGSRFGHPGPNFRLGYARKTLPQALLALEAGLDRMRIS